MLLIKVERQITVDQRRQAWQLILEMLIVVRVFYRLLFHELIAVVVDVAVVFLVTIQLALYLMCLPHLGQVRVLLSQILQLCFDVYVLCFQSFRFTHQIVDAFTLLKPTLGCSDFVSLTTTFSSIFIFGR